MMMMTMLMVLQGN